MVDDEGRPVGLRELSLGKPSFRRRERRAWATGLSLVLHVLMLAGMVLGLKVVQPPPEDRALELSLVRPLERIPVPVTPRPAAPPQTVRAAPPPVSPRLAPQQPAASVPGVAAPEVKAPPQPAPRVYGPGVEENGVKPSLSGRLGCDDDPLGRKALNPEQKQACANNLVARAKAAPPILDIPAAKLAEYERNAACKRAYTQQGIPRSASSTAASVADNLPSALPGGLGSIPARKDCGFGDR